MEKKNGDEQLDSIRFEREREVENRPESLLVERVQLFLFFLSLSLFFPSSRRIDANTPLLFRVSPQRLHRVD